MDCVIRPAQSPDLNPIENTWCWIGNYLGQKYGKCDTLASLQEAFREAWGDIPAHIIMEDVASLPQWLQDVRDNAGGTTSW